MFRRSRSAALMVLGVMSTHLLLPSANADECAAAGSAGVDFVDVGVVCEQRPSDTATGPTSPTQPSPFVAYRWASACTATPFEAAPVLECPAALTCAEPRERRWQLWGRLANGSWQTIRAQCFGGVPPEYVPPTVTPGHVLSALRRIGLPRLEIQVQPEAKTLVNFDTIFWTDPQTVDLDLTILGQGVDVVATPISYRWGFGDGTETTTSDPGDPFPAKTVTHRYSDAGVTVRPHVSVSYGARFRVSGGAWQDIDETVTTEGPPASLSVAEATPLLSGSHR